MTQLTRVASNWPGLSKHQVTPFGGLCRSVLMSRIQGRRNASTELRLASLLRGASISGWRRHLPLPGHPDFAWPTERVVAFVDGCFWHGHNCGRNLTARSNAGMWRTKISLNRRRDRRVSRSLRADGWRVIRVWECALAKRPTACVTRLLKLLKFQRSREQNRALNRIHYRGHAIDDARKVEYYSIQ